MNRDLQYMVNPKKLHYDQMQKIARELLLKEPGSNALFITSSDEIAEHAFDELEKWVSKYMVPCVIDRGVINGRRRVEFKENNSILDVLVVRRESSLRGRPCSMFHIDECHRFSYEMVEDIRQIANYMKKDP